jgi:hypothetical protein
LLCKIQRREREERERRFIRPVCPRIDTTRVNTVISHRNLLSESAEGDVTMRVNTDMICGNRKKVTNLEIEV